MGFQRNFSTTLHYSELRARLSAVITLQWDHARMGERMIFYLLVRDQFVNRLHIYDVDILSQSANYVFEYLRPMCRGYIFEVFYIGM